MCRVAHLQSINYEHKKRDFGAEFGSSKLHLSISFPFLLNNLAATMNPWVTTKGSRVRMLRYPVECERLGHL
jgi:hypothetical protein